MEFPDTQLPEQKESAKVVSMLVQFLQLFSIHIFILRCTWKASSVDNIPGM